MGYVRSRHQQSPSQQDMGTAVRTAKTSPASWDAFSDVDAFVDEVLAELAAMEADGTKPTRPGRFRQVSRQILSGGTDQPWRAVSSSGDGEHIAESCDPLDIDHPSTSRGHVLLAPGGRSEEVAHLVVGQAEAEGAGVGLETPHRAIAPFYAPVILLEMVV